jgi:hypothetical protein
MTFEDRNLNWNGNTREFRQINSRSTAPRVWRVTVVNNIITTVWGQLGGAEQVAQEVSEAINKGKSNEKTPEVAALEKAKRMALLKYREGYREYVNGTALDVAESTIDFDDLPNNLCFYKPDNSMGVGITKKAEAGNVLYSRKRNGLAFVITRGKRHPLIYSRRMMRQHDDEVGTSLTWNDRFPQIVEAAAKVMPQNSIMLGELVVDRKGYDDFAAIQSLTKSLTLESLTRQKQDKPASFYIWDIAFWDGQDLVTKSPVMSRYSLIHELEFSDETLIPVQFFDSSIFPVPQAALTIAKHNKWEGFVVIDPEGVYGDKGYNFKGKPDRPAAFCAKLKPSFEDDFIAIWDPEAGHGERSTKKSNDRGIKSVALYQRDSEGELVYICNVSSGLSKDQIREWSDPKKFPMVWKVEYTERFFKSQGDETNALIFPRFVEVRTDKKVEECILQEPVS